MTPLAERLAAGEQIPSEGECALGEDARIRWSAAQIEVEHRNTGRTTRFGEGALAAVQISRTETSGWLGSHGAVHAELRPARPDIERIRLLAPADSARLDGLPELHLEGERIPLDAFVAVVDAARSLGARILVEGATSRTPDERAPSPVEPDLEPESAPPRDEDPEKRWRKNSEPIISVSAILLFLVALVSTAVALGTDDMYPAGWSAASVAMVTGVAAMLLGPRRRVPLFYDGADAMTRSGSIGLWVVCGASLGLWVLVLFSGHPIGGLLATVPVFGAGWLAWRSHWGATLERLDLLIEEQDPRRMERIEGAIHSTRPIEVDSVASVMLVSDTATGSGSRRRTVLRYERARSPVLTDGQEGRQIVVPPQTQLSWASALWRERGGTHEMIVADGAPVVARGIVSARDAADGSATHVLEDTDSRPAVLLAASHEVGSGLLYARMLASSIKRGHYAFTGGFVLAIVLSIFALASLF